MPRDPISNFGNLMVGCIRDEKVAEKTRVILESVLFLALGLASSAATAYVLSLTGIFV